MDTPEIVKINDVTYIKQDSVGVPAETLNGMPYVICRTHSAGVFAGYLEKRIGVEVVLRSARRLWYWAGAASLSEAAEHGFSKPDNCKFPCTVDKVELLNAIEILYCSKDAQESIEKVRVWTAS